jgi:hypothetical protein
VKLDSIFFGNETFAMRTADEFFRETPDTNKLSSAPRTILMADVISTRFAPIICAFSTVIANVDLFARNENAVFFREGFMTSVTGIAHWNLSPEYYFLSCSAH